MMRIILIAGLMALTTATAGAQQQPYFCPAPEDVWVMDKEFPDAPAWRYEARVRGNALGADSTDFRRQSRPVRVPTRPASSVRGRAPSTTQNRPIVAPMLTHARAVGVDANPFVSNPDMPPVMAALEWVAAEAGQFGSVCRYSLQDGQPGGRNATATIPINRRDCEAQPGTMVWRHDSQVSGWSCDASRTDCLFFCAAEAVLETW
ncbi:hypothetical protein AWH62_11270 [Maricaulis sp. W15]|uniref:hypothetical protein n=1 Tax=Maricaulis sp. W15 TaxID=1772333 RepID=UPI0009491A1D|nr:hypothetical protein [Maricaulis sp. W15]OLF72401.1 hypothetical protein AWH62_11270 [Maricaulis sp. W15]